MSIDSGFYRKERSAGNDTAQVRESERRSNNPYDSSYNNSSSYRKNEEQKKQEYEEAISKLEYYNNHFENLAKDATKEQLFLLESEIRGLKFTIQKYELEQKIKTQIYEAEEQAQQMRGRKF